MMHTQSPQTAPSRWIKRLAVVVGTVAMGAGLWLGLSTSRADPGAARRERGVSSKRAVVASLLSERAQRAQLGLPEGVSIDPVTGMLIGASLEAAEGVRAVPWDLIQAYEYQQGLKDLPDAIRDLDGQEVMMLGFLMASYDYDDIREFHLVASHWSCCYGVPPGLSGTVYVNLAEDAEGMPLTISPIRVQGIFRVKEFEEAGIVFSIFGLEDAEAREIKW